MKNFGIVFLLTLAVSATSCKKDVITDVQKGESISFQPLLSASSKVAPTEQGNLNTFSVRSRATNAEFSSFNFEETYTKSQNNWTQGSSQAHYWPRDFSAEFKFTAYSPTNFTSSLEGGATVVEENGSVFIKNIQPKRQAVEQLDLLVAETNYSRSEGASVPLTFKHVFSQIIIQAQCDDPSLTVEVYGVKLGNVIQSANLRIKNTEATGQLSGVWSSYGTNRTTYISGSIVTTHQAVTLNTTPQNIMMGGGSFMVLPQAPDRAWNGSAQDVTGPYIAVLCRIKKGTTLLYPTSESKYAYAAVGVGTQWTAGNTYTYTVKFFSNGGGAGKVPPEIMDPSAPGGMNVVDMSVTPGTTVVGGPLSFSVSTTDWTNNDNSDNPLNPR